MVSFLVRYPCDDCFTASGLLEEVESALNNYGTRIWRNKVFLLGRPVDKTRIKKILYYKDILKNLLFDPFYYGPKYPYQDIDSRIKQLINAVH